tara:strand:- start:449 stop:1219 length:771 start_codon:yes stop_codon:yes gene_type:complete
MEKFLSVTMLLPLLQNQEYAAQTIAKFLGGSEYQRRLIVEQAAELNQKPLIKEFQFPTKATKTKNKLRHYVGYATATETILERTGFAKREIKMEMSLIKDLNGKFEFILQCDEDNGYIVTCKITPKYRGQGLFPVMVEAITKHGFNDLGLRSVSGSARPPRDETERDWRYDRISYRNNFETGEIVKLTRLHKLWLSQKYAVHSKVIGSDDPEGFAILNPKYLSELPKEELVNLDEYHPKSEENTFVYLMKKKGAVL